MVIWLAFPTWVSQFHAPRSSRVPQGVPVMDPYRQSLMSALSWFDVALARLQRRAYSAIEAEMAAAAAAERVGDEHRVVAAAASIPPKSMEVRQADQDPMDICDNDEDPVGSAGDSQEVPAPWEHIKRAAVNVLGADSLTRTSVHQSLTHICPACFFGPYLPGQVQGADFHVAVDGNFQHHHNITAGECPDIGHTLTRFLPAEIVEAARLALSDARKRPARAYHGRVPENAIMSCRRSHKSGDGDTAKAVKTIFDDTGLVAITCRHDRPLFLVNLDTPGEQHHFALAAIAYVKLLLPADSTLHVHYDIGCVMSHSFEIVSSPPGHIP